MTIYRPLGLLLGLSILSFPSYALSFSELRFFHKPGHASGHNTADSNAKDSKAQYLLILGSFKVRGNARDYRKMLASQLDVPVHLKRTRNALYVVYVGPFDDIGTRNALRRKLSSLQAHHYPEAHAELPVWTRLSKYIPRDVSPLITFSLGPAFTEAGKTQTLLLWPDTQYGYIAAKNADTLGFADVFLGGTHHINEKYEAQLGISILGATNVNPTGDVLIESNPRFNNFSYGYKINHSHIALNGKLVSKIDFHALHVQPYISGGLGAGFNRAYQFSMTSKLFEAVVPPLFQPNTETSFVYTVGLGLQKSLNKHWLLGAGYAFSDWGKSKLSAAPRQTETGYGLALNHLYINAFVLGFTYRPTQIKNN